MAQMKYVRSGKKVIKNRYNFVYLKDIYATKILRDERNRDYILKIVCAALGKELDKMAEEFEVVDIRLGLSNQNVDSEADVVFKNAEGYYNIEVNFSYNGTTEVKNLSYSCELVLRQLKGEAKIAYENIKPIIQINLNSYDQFEEGRFMYVSKLMETTLNKIRSELITIIDINLDFLANLDYTNIKKYGKDSLERLLYIFVCNDKSILDEMYVGDLIMEKIKSQLYDLEENLDNYLFYDREEYYKKAVFSTGELEGKNNERARIIKHMKANGLSNKAISEMMDLTEEKILEILKREKIKDADS